MTHEHERLLVTYSSLLSNVIIDKLETAIRGEIVFVDGKACSVGDTRIDKEAHKIYGTLPEVPTYGEYR